VPEKKARLDAIIDDRIKDLNMAESIAMNVDMSEQSKTVRLDNFIYYSIKHIDVGIFGIDYSIGKLLRVGHWI
jgi:hypothetical protein